MPSFSQETRLTGSVNAELLDGTRLRVERRRLFRKPIRFTVDVACLSPALAITSQEGAVALGLATLFALTLALLAIYGLARNELLPLGAWSGMAIAAFTIAVTLAVAFRLRLLKRLVVQTRCAGVPLLVTSVVPEKRGDLQIFLALLRIGIGAAETKRGLNAEQLRSGELKTLRRLAAENVILPTTYDHAKSIILHR